MLIYGLFPFLWIISLLYCVKFFGGGGQGFGTFRIGLKKGGSP
jgi:hypothetical protein